MNFEYTTDFLLQIPEDTVFFQFDDENAFLLTAVKLLRSGHVFVTSPKHAMIAMSRAGAQQIGLL